MHHPFKIAFALTLLLGALMPAAPGRADPIPEVGGHIAPDEDVFKTELKGMKAWEKLQRDVRSCLDRGAKNHSRDKDTKLQLCLTKVQAKFDAKLAPLDLPGCWDPDALFEATEQQAKAVFRRVYCDETAALPVCGDGALAEWEECDDGNLDDGDCCSSACTFAPAGSACPADGNVCTSEVCNGSGACVSEPSAGSCDDGLFCTATDICAGGVCVGAGDPCAGGDACNDTCDEVAGSCAETGTLCEDGLFCTAGDTCQAGLCTGGGDACAAGDACNSTCNEALFTCYAAAGTGCLGGQCDNGGVCILEQGGACASDGECAGYACVDGFCCDTACASGCEACSAALTGGSDGVCAPIVAGTDPDDECGVSGGSDVCGGSGSCTQCGDGRLEIGEECDDGNLTSGDCCSSVCEIETEISGCAPSARIVTPLHGAFTEASSVIVEGWVENIHPTDATLTVGGSPVSIAANLSFSTVLSIDPAEIFQPIVSTLTRLSDGEIFNDRVVVIRGQAVADGSLVPDGIGMRLTDVGLDAIEPAVTGLVDIDPKSMIPDGTVILDDYCYADTFLGCLGRIDVSVKHTATLPGISGFGIDIDSQNAFVEGDITLHDLAVRAHVVNVTGIGISCDIDITTATTQILGDYTLEPMALSPSKVDVTHQGGVMVVLGGFSNTTNCGGILGGIMEWLIGLFMGDMESMVADGLQNFLDEVDGNGNTPIAGAIEAALGNIDIAGPVGDGLGTELTTPFNAIEEDLIGITFPIDAGFATLVPDPAAPDLLGALIVPTTFPVFPVTTPVMGQGYGVVLAFSPTTFNQFLMEGIEGGLMRMSIAELEVGGAPLAINSTMLSIFLPAFATLPALTPLEIRVAPTLAPIVTDEAGPDGELANLQLAHLLIEIVQPNAGDAVRLTAAVDMQLGLDLVPEPGGLAISIGSPPLETLVTTLLHNPLGVDPAAVDALIPTMMDLMLPELAGALGSFPLPEFLGVSLAPIEVSRQDDYLAIFADLAP
ncbi:MAG: DUF4215 domain-containing protein [Deltaproteobacteria bacterium]